MARKAKRPRSEMDNEQPADNEEIFQKEDPKGDNFECYNQRVNIQEEEEVLSEGASSSYSGSMCGNDDDEDEAQSILDRDFPLPDLRVETEFSKKKKVSDHWIEKIKATRWITKWLEIKSNEMLSRVRLYNKEVQSCETDLENLEVNIEETSSVPFRNQTRKKEHFKRKTRKRVEDTTDIDDYRANHHIFSYADKRKSGASNAQCVGGHEPSQKVVYKENEDEIESLIAAIAELESKDILETVLSKILKEQEKTKSMKKRLDRFISESQSEHVKEPLIASQQSGSEATLSDHSEGDQSRNQTRPTGQILNLSPLRGAARIIEHMDDEEYVIVDGTEEFENLFRVLKKELNNIRPFEDDLTSQ